MTARKRPTQKQLVAKADALFSLVVRSPGRCVICGTTERLQCAHGFSRRHRNTRWDERNAWPMCAAHHQFFTHRPLEWDEWMLAQMGADVYWEVRRLALSTEKVDLSAVLARLIVRQKELAA
jgi:hypothetical protein